MEMLHTEPGQVALAELPSEIEEVRRQLFTTLAELAPPLGELVQSQLGYSISNLRIGLLLTAASGSESSPQAQQQRILLSAGLEMLYLGLSIHKLLLAYSQQHADHRPDRAWTGSVILAGDYCLSRSALLVAKTNIPQVVDIFADALKTVNEEMLRRLFATKVDSTAGTSAEPFDEEPELIKAGLQAATVLAGLAEPEALATIAFGQKLFKQLATNSPATRTLEPPISLAHPPYTRWQALIKLYKTNGALL